MDFLCLIKSNANILCTTIRYISFIGQVHFKTTYKCDFFLAPATQRVKLKRFTNQSSKINDFLSKCSAPS